MAIEMKHFRSLETLLEKLMQCNWADTVSGRKFGDKWWDTYVGLQIFIKLAIYCTQYHFLFWFPIFQQKGPVLWDEKSLKFKNWILFVCDTVMVPNDPKSYICITSNVEPDSL